MKLRHLVYIASFCLVFFIPMKVLAVDFEITDVEIDVYLQEDGNAEVTEKHTYVFDSKFKGITREIFPKTGSSILHFEAFENEQLLKVEKENQLYKVFRSGKKGESIDFLLNYTLTNTVEKYEDGTQFYFSFFSDRNESDYGNMKIVIHPPSKALNVDFLGYDSAYATGESGLDGIVTFSIGEVPAGKLGDVRVIYESELFPGVTMEAGKIRPDLAADRAQMEADRAAFVAKQEDYKLFGVFVVPTTVLALLSLLAFLFGKRRRTQQEAFYRMEEDFVPKSTLSMPGIIQYTAPISLGPERLSAALLDLIRQGYVKQIDEETFELLTREGVREHEAALIDLLFKQVGDGIYFSLDDLEHYTENKNNHASYSSGLHKWRNGLLAEVKAAELGQQSTKLRIGIALVSLLLIAPIILLGIYELYPFMAVLIVAAFIGLLTAILYTPRSVKGMEIYEAWKQFRKKVQDVSVEEWQALPADDKYRAYIYGIGLKDAKLNHLYERFERAEKNVGQAASVGMEPSFVAYNPVFMTSGFTTANQNAAVNADGSAYSSSSSGGGGVGGSGGGSGAF